MKLIFLQSRWGAREDGKAFGLRERGVCECVPRARVQVREDPRAAPAGGDHCVSVRRAGPPTPCTWDHYQLARPSRPVSDAGGGRQRTHICPVRDFF